MLEIPKWGVDQNRLRNPGLHKGLPHTPIEDNDMFLFFIFIQLNLVKMIKILSLSFGIGP